MAKSTSFSPSARARVSVTWLVGTHRMSRRSFRTRSERAWIAREAVRPVPRPTIIPGLTSATAASASASAIFGSLLKGDPLCEFELGPEVDGAGLPPHVRFPGIGPRLPAPARVLLAADRPADLGPAGAQVHVGDPAVAPAPRGAQ